MASPAKKVSEMDHFTDWNTIPIQKMNPATKISKAQPHSKMVNCYQKQ